MEQDNSFVSSHSSILEILDFKGKNFIIAKDLIKNINASKAGVLYKLRYLDIEKVINESQLMNVLHQPLYIRYFN